MPGQVTARLGRLALAPIAALEGARGTLFPWIPVCLAIGIGFWFALPDEPAAWVYAVACAAVLGLLVLWRLGPEWAQPICLALALVPTGGVMAGLRAHMVAAPVLDFRYYGAVTGRIVMIDRSQSDALRLTLDEVLLDDVAPARIPHRVRISLHGPEEMPRPEPGDRVQLTAHLAAPQGMVEPGGFDFQRMAWFQRLGAVGYSRTPVMYLAPPSRSEQWVNRTRSWLSAGIQNSIGGDAGAFAAGVMTGDRSGLSGAATEALRASSLAHLLAISGMNMAFLIGFVFAFLRHGIAMVPPLALRINAKKLSAAVSLGVAWFYLLLSGANVATERAFIMVCVMLGAVLLDRRALSLRSVALSGIVLLMLRPESLLDPGFQMSFAATTALIAGFGALEGGVLRGRIPRWCLPVFTLVLSSALAGAATAPYGAAHFNRVADFGFFANLLTVPVMGIVVMPAGAVAALAAPFGLADLPLWIMGLGCQWILFIAAEVGAMEGAVTPVIAPGPWVLPLLTLGGLWLVIWRGRARLAGIAVIAGALWLWSGATRPDLLIAPDGALVGLMTAEGRALSVPRGAGFAARSWLENDGDLALQPAAAARAAFDGPQDARAFRLGAWRGLHLRGKGAAAAAAAACANADLVIVAAKLATWPEGCVIFDLADLDRSGGLAIRLDAAGLKVTPAIGGRRIWQGAAARTMGGHPLVAPEPLVLPKRAAPMRVRTDRMTALPAGQTAQGGLQPGRDSDG
ncbi:ComEC/Rec2 family competence protein [Gemmobacter serpentinus]|uniref:ComEC/Rec2 family competence protein n=1 Tax=Gemmobacter serpentinus TaxID=2652247 RepID=UPI001CF675C5|nr:ComEC/Rec2 family competence protein [Gemmobacter serpentinus]